MRKYTRSELIVFKAALLVDKYVYDYYYCIYAESIGTKELQRVEHINQLIQTISGCDSEINVIIKTIENDVVNIKSKDKADTINRRQLNDAVEILNLLSAIY